MIKTFEIIPEGDGFLMVDYADVKSSFSLPYKIIAHTGIKSLKDSNFPLFEINQNLSAKDFVNKIYPTLVTNWGESAQLLSFVQVIELMEGYKAVAGKYTEEDMWEKAAYWFGRGILAGKTGRVDELKPPKKDDFIKFRKKYPISADVEMKKGEWKSYQTTYDQPDRDEWIEYDKPKLPVDKYNHLIIKQFNYA